MSKKGRRKWTIHFGRSTLCFVLYPPYIDFNYQLEIIFIYISFVSTSGQATSFSILQIRVQTERSKNKILKSNKIILFILFCFHPPIPSFTISLLKMMSLINSNWQTKHGFRRKAPFQQTIANVKRTNIISKSLKKCVTKFNSIQQVKKEREDALN